MASGIDMQGLDGIVASLETIVNKQNIERGLQKACAIVEASAKQKAPKGAGELRRSITSRIEGEEGVVYTPLEYAPYVEFGTGLFAEDGGRMDVPWNYQDDKGEWHSTSGMKPQPFLRPALNENREKIKRILGEEILNG